MGSQSEGSNEILDLSKLKSAFMDDLTIIKEILGSFQDSIQNFEADFKALEQAGDQEELSRLVHNLKGSSANIRANSLSSQAADLQKKIDQNQDYSAGIHSLVESLADLENVINKIKAQ